jgi:hypothetical protein
LLWLKLISAVVNSGNCLFMFFLDCVYFLNNYLTNIIESTWFSSSKQIKKFFIYLFISEFWLKRSWGNSFSETILLDNLCSSWLFRIEKSINKSMWDNNQFHLVVTIMCAWEINFSGLIVSFISLKVMIDFWLHLVVIFKIWVRIYDFSIYYPNSWLKLLYFEQIGCGISNERD